MESTLIYHMGYIKAHFAHNRKRIFYTTKVKVQPDMVDGRGFVKPKSHDNWQNLNQQILIHKQRLDTAILKDLQTYDYVDVERIKSALNDIVMEQENATPSIDKGMVPLSKMLEDFLSNQPKMNRGLKWRYQLLLNIIKENNKLCKQIKVPYLHEILDEFRGRVNANTASTRYKNFKRFLIWCQESGYPLRKIEWKRLSKPTFKPDFVFLTDEKIEELISYQPTNDLESKAKQIFLVLIYTGMRYSDYSSLKPTEIYNGCIDKIALKTKIRFKVPIHSSIAEILKAPPKMCGQIFNKEIKQIGNNIGWTEIVRYRKDINEFDTIPFYEMLCSSVGRHTFATRALLSGVPHNIIMGWCGWTNSGMLFYYSEKLKIQTTDWMDKIK